MTKAAIEHATAIRQGNSLAAVNAAVVAWKYKVEDSVNKQKKEIRYGNGVNASNTIAKIK